MDNTGAEDGCRLNYMGFDVKLSKLKANIACK